MKKILLSFLFLLFFFPIKSQYANLIWATAAGGTGLDNGYSITIDQSGNLYATGTFQGIVDFDPGPGVFNLTSNGIYDMFIQKLDASGNLLWATTAGGTGYCNSTSITTDQSGNVYVTGSFNETVDFDPGTGVFNLTSNGHSDMFIQKLDANGNFLWAKAAGGTNFDNGSSITIDQNGDVYTSGTFYVTVDFDPGSGVFNLTSNGSSDIFIQKLDANGNFLWATALGGAGGDNGNSITTDQGGNAYITGYFNGAVDFDPGAGIFNLTSNGDSDMFIQKLLNCSISNNTTINDTIFDGIPYILNGQTYNCGGLIVSY